MAEPLKLYLDQMLRMDVAQALRDEGHDVMRASEVGQARADDYEILQKAISENRISKHPGVIRLKVNPATSKNAINLILPFLRLYSSEHFTNRLVMLSSKRAKWVHTA